MSTFHHYVILFARFEENICLGQFQAIRGILEKCLLEEMCLELKIALKNGLKNVQEAFLPISKRFLNTFETNFQCSF